MADFSSMEWSTSVLSSCISLAAEVEWACQITPFTVNGLQIRIRSKTLLSEFATRTELRDKYEQIRVNRTFLCRDGPGRCAFMNFCWNFISIEQKIFQVEVSIFLGWLTYGSSFVNEKKFPKCHWEHNTCTEICAQNKAAELDLWIKSIGRVIDNFD